ncbi:hypothetical protein ACWEWX_52895, partial [Streptomyces asiaticus]
GAGLGCALDFSTDLFDRATARSIADRFVRVLASWSCWRRAYGRRANRAGEGRVSPGRGRGTMETRRRAA